MQRFTRFSGVLLALTLIAPCFGWGEAGHRIAGLIATRYLTEKTRAAVEDLLGETTLARAGTWADEIRKDHAYDWAKPLHYLNVPHGSEGIDMARDCPGGECVLGAIERFGAVLNDPQAERPAKVE